jgi:ribonuclease HI
MRTKIREQIERFIEKNGNKRCLEIQVVSDGSHKKDKMGGGIILTDDVDGETSLLEVAYPVMGTPYHSTQAEWAGIILMLEALLETVEQTQERKFSNIEVFHILDNKIAGQQMNNFSEERNRTRMSVSSSDLMWTHLRAQYLIRQIMSEGPNIVYSTGWRKGHNKHTLINRADVLANTGRRMQPVHSHLRLEDLKALPEQPEFWLPPAAQPSYSNDKEVSKYGTFSKLSAWPMKYQRTGFGTEEQPQQGTLKRPNRGFVVKLRYGRFTTYTKNGRRVCKHCKEIGSLHHFLMKCPMTRPTVETAILQALTQHPQQGTFIRTNICEEENFTVSCKERHHGLSCIAPFLGYLPEGVEDEPPKYMAAFKEVSAILLQATFDVVPQMIECTTESAGIPTVPQQRIQKMTARTCDENTESS